MKRNLVKGYLWQRWKDIPNYEGLYKCSSLGKVRSFPIFNRNFEIILKTTIGTSGYYIVGLYKNKKCKKFSIHVIMAMSFLKFIPDGHKLVIDHKNGDKLKNYLHNIKIVTHRENSTTCYIKNNNTYSSKYVGVTWNKKSKKWRAGIYINHKKKHLGMFANEIDASNAYQNELLKYKSTLNF